MITNNILGIKLKVSFSFTILSVNLLADLLQYINFIFLVALAKIKMSLIILDIWLAALILPVMAWVAICESLSMMRGINAPR